ERRDLGRFDENSPDGAAVGIPPGPLGDPLANQAVFPRIRGQTNSAPVRFTAGGVGEEQTVVWRIHIDATRIRFAQNRYVIQRRRLTEEAQSKASLSLERSVAGRTVAPQPAEQTGDMALEVDLGEDHAPW